MISIPLDAAAALHARFVIPPAVHAVDCLLALLRPHRAPHASAWRAQVAFEPSRVPLLHAMVAAETWYLPDFLMPLAEDAPATAIRATDPELIEFQLALAFRSPLLGEPRSQAMDPATLASRRRPPLPTALAEAWASGRFADLVADEFAAFWASVVVPRWPLVRGVLDEDILFRARRLATHGLASLFDPGWDQRVLRLDSHHDVAFTDRREVLFAPAVFTWPRPTCVLQDLGSITVVYPARGSATIWAAPEPAAADDTRLLGARRRRLLDDLAEPRSPHQLALRHHLSRATVSYHLGLLREAGLVEAQRAGRLVYYRRTPRAEAFLKA